MKIFLDTKELINIFEKSTPCRAEDFGTLLEAGNHQLVISFVNVLEISAPLLRSKSIETNVMNILRRIESVPTLFIKGELTRLELEAAIQAFNQGTEYCPPDPFVLKYGDALPGEPEDPYALKRGLSEFVYMLIVSENLCWTQTRTNMRATTPLTE